MLNYRQLTHALVLHEQGNFTRAAARTNISQSAFSRSIRNLEESLGVVLFDREGSQVTATRYGEALLERARAIVDDTAELQREIDLMSGLEIGRFAIALGLYPAEVSGNRALGEMLLNYPSLRYRAFVGNWETVNEQVLSRTVDLGFVAIEAAEHDERLAVEQVSQHEMALYCGQDHPLAGCKSVSRSDLDQFPLVSIRVPSGLAAAVPGKAHIAPDGGHLVPAVEIDDLATARTVIKNSNGIGAAIPLQIEAQLLSGELVLLKYQRPWLTPPHGFILLKHRTLSPAAEVFMASVTRIEKNAHLRNVELLEKYLG
ncbi:MAG: DNA-binding transcriptional LysR family regulator [Halioglobus sp.]|jgi:DNA-binding transcriptional LysR family regulator